MRTKFLLSAVLGLGLGLGLATAASASSVITIDARYFAGGVPFATSADYVNEWNLLAATPPTPGYLTQTLPAWDNVSNPGSSNLAYHDSVQFKVSAGQTGVWSFIIGPDFGYGGTLLVDGVVLDTKTSDLWWAGDRNNSTQTLIGSINLGVGLHSIDAYGFEACCNGGSSGFFKAPGAANYTVFTASVPEPATWSMLLIGFGSLGIAARLRRRIATRNA